jgi:carboxyl-terminal processing protease
MQILTVPPRSPDRVRHRRRAGLWGPLPMAALTALVIIVGYLAGARGGALLRDRPAPHGFVAALLGPSRGEEIAGLLADKYYRDVDADVFRTAPVAQIPALLHDPYTRYLSPEAYARSQSGDVGSYVGVGLVVDSRRAGLVTDLVTGGPAERAGIRDGDEILRVDGGTVAGLPGTTVLQRLHGVAGAVVRVDVRRAGAVRSFVLTRKRLRAKLVVAQRFTLHGRRIGYVRLREFDEGVGQQVREAARRLVAVQRSEGLVLDLRGNPGGLTDEALLVASAFLPRGSLVYTTTGRHITTEGHRTELVPVTTTTPLVVLVDGESASSAEIVTGALRDSQRAWVAGRRSFGKGVIQQLWPLQTGGALAVTTAEYTTPAGTPVQGRGISPDLELPESADADLAGLLEVAVAGMTR